MHSVSILENQAVINQQRISFPMSLDALKSLFGTNPASKTTKYNTVYTWHPEGVYAYSPDGKQINGIAFEIKKEKIYPFIPTNVFQGKIELNGIPLEQYTPQKAKQSDNYARWVVGNTVVFLDLNDNDEILTVEFSLYTPIVIPDPDRYIIKPIEGMPIKFTDINFKLAVIQVLMYEKELIKPAFDIFEFAKRYKDRTIDTDSEGYEIIPEALQYFEQLPIDEKLAPHIDELTQDGGNDIYMNIIPFWSGTTDDFNIQSFQDVDQFPNLKHITLFYDPRLEEIQESLSKKGIAVDPL